MVALGTFIFLSRNEEGGCQPVGLVVPDGILRLWSDAEREGWCAYTSLISGDHRSWLDSGRYGSDVHVITPDHAAYPAWWAWYCACQLGARHAPPVEEIGYDPSKLRDPNQS